MFSNRVELHCSVTVLVFCYSVQSCVDVQKLYLDILLVFSKSVQLLYWCSFTLFRDDDWCSIPVLIFSNVVQLCRVVSNSDQ